MYIKTCSNCRYYCSTIADVNSSFHIHNYCKVWRSVIPSDFLANKEYEKRLNNGELNNGEDDDIVVYDDIESNKATCWCWEPKCCEEG